ncbi:hypothetical protein PSHT_03319 [Puccinia striiformis]|uniref:Methyltransferase domain-containing protein n=1 Tax=Puccinia striiformis TaxID=27350 RepID=A0A2S4WFK4_9BASI|nr:hypothetical protein PSHT_03319 [Puccinia striiformis]
MVYAQPVCKTSSGAYPGSFILKTGARIRPATRPDTLQAKTPHAVHHLRRVLQDTSTVYRDAVPTHVDLVVAGNQQSFLSSGLWLSHGLISGGNQSRQLQTQSKRHLQPGYFTTRPTISPVEQQLSESKLDRQPESHSRFLGASMGTYHFTFQGTSQEENLTVATSEHWSRGETELNWLKDGASAEKTGHHHHVNELLADWVDQHVTKKKPLAYILQNIPFGDLTFNIRPPILIPRPETEQWVVELSRTMDSYFQTAKSAISCSDEPTLPHTPKLSRPSSFKVLDLGTGSGCISNYLAYHHQDVHAVGVDIDQDAVRLARENATIHKILCPNKPIPTNRNSKGRASFFNLDLFSPTFTQNLKQASQSLAGFDMIISNPPYIPLAEFHNLPPSVKSWESSIALIGDRNSVELSGLERVLSRSNRPSGDYGFFTSYRSSFSPLAPGRKPAPDSRIDEAYMGGVGRTESAAGSMVLKDQKGPASKKDGLDFYRQIIQLIARGDLVKPDSSNFHRRSKSIGQQLPKLVLEVGQGQACSVKELILHFLPGMITQVLIVKDFAGIDRTLLCY